MLTVPDRVAPDCVTCIVIEPGPDESVAVPRHDPATFRALTVGAAGVDDDDSPRQAPIKTSAASPGTNSSRRTWTIGSREDTSVSDRQAVLPHVGAAHQHAGARIDAD